MTQLAQRLRLYLPDPLARDVELFAHFLERVVGVHVDTEPHAQDLRFTRGQLRKYRMSGFAQRLHRRLVDRGRHRLVLDEVTQMRVLIVTDGSLHRDRLLGDLQNLAHLVFGHLHPHRQLFRGGLTAHLLQHLARDAVQLVDRLDHVHRDTDGARLIGDRAGDRLPDPPRRIRAELVAAAIFELVHRLHQADVAFLDQVEELQAAVRVFLGDRNHEAQVGLHHLLLRPPGLRLADRDIAVDFLDVIDRQVILHLEVLELLLPPLDLVFELRERRRILLPALDVLLQPLRARLVFREGRDEILARHPGVTHRDDHDFLLELPDFPHVRAQVQDQRIEHARRQLQLHELVGQLLACLERLGLLRAELLDRAENARVALADGQESRSGLFRIRHRDDRLLFGVAGAFLSLIFVVSLLVGFDQLHLRRILRLRDHVRRIRVDEPDDDVHEARLSGLHRLIGPKDEIISGRVHRQRTAHRIKAFLDALGDADLAFAREQLHSTHLAHVHAHRVGGAAQLRIERSQGGGRLLDSLFVSRLRRLGLQQRLGIRCLFVHRNAHVVDRIDDVFNLLRIHDLGGQMVIHLGIGQVALLLAAGNQKLELRLAIFGHHGGTALYTERRLLLDSILCAAAVLSIGWALSRPGRLYGLHGGDNWLLRCLAQRCSGLLQTVFFTNRRHRGYGFLCRSRFDWLARVGSSRAFLGSDGRLVLACHGVEMTKRDDPLCAGPGPATQGGLIEQSAQFYLTGLQTPNSVATRRAHRGDQDLT